MSHDFELGRNVSRTELIIMLWIIFHICGMAEVWVSQILYKAEPYQVLALRWQTTPKWAWHGQGQVTIFKFCVSI